MSCSIPQGPLACIHQNATYKGEGVVVRDTETPPYDYSQGNGTTARVQLKEYVAGQLGDSWKEGPAVLTIDWNETQSTITRPDNTTQVGPALVYTYTHPTTSTVYNTGTVFFPIYLTHETTELIPTGTYWGELRVVPPSGEPFYAIMIQVDVINNATHPA